MNASGFKMYSRAAKDAQYELIERYAPLVKRIAYHLLARLPANVQVEDLIQAGMIGLLEVANKYDASKGASFETYLKHPHSRGHAGRSAQRRLGAAFGTPQHPYGQ